MLGKKVHVQRLLHAMLQLVAKKVAHSWKVSELVCSPWGRSPASHWRRYRIRVVARPVHVKVLCRAWIFIVIKYYLEQRTEAWHAARRGKLTASNLGALLGQVSYTSRAEAFRRALGTDEFQGNEATEWGTANEPNGIAYYEQVTGNKVVETGLHTHPNYNWIAGSPDGLVGSEGIVEIKCPYWQRTPHAAIPGHFAVRKYRCKPQQVTFDDKGARPGSEPSSSFETRNLPRDLVIILTCHLLHYDCMTRTDDITDDISGL